jgi:hypothetical protein
MKNILHLFLLTLALGFTACVDLEFDSPPVAGEDPALTPNITIKDLKARHLSGAFEKIEEDLILSAVVVADDRSGNYYKTLVVQDSSGGIELKINSTGLYNDFPIGRRVYIKAKGLTLGDYNGVIQLGLGTYIDGSNTRLSSIEEALIPTYVTKGPRNQPLPVKVKSITELAEGDISTLVELVDVQFSVVDTGQALADAVGKVSVNRTIQDCNNKTLILRTSGFADFASKTAPAAKGKITGVYSVFGRDKQLFLREYSDLQLKDARCNTGGGGGGGGGVNLITIADLRGYFTGTAVKAPSFIKIKGVVISDRAFSNWDGRNLVIQDASAGIMIRFTENHNFNMGDEIEIEVGALELSEFNKLLQVNNTPANRASKLGIGVMPTPREATAKEVFDNQEAWESTLVIIKNATLSGGANFSGTRKINDASGSIDMFTRTAATFAGQALPAGTVSVTAVVSQFNTPQVILRNPSDIK